MSKAKFTLQDIVSVYRQWLTKADKLEETTTYNGLCYHLSIAAGAADLEDLHDSLLREAGLHIDYPFGRREYYLRRHECTMHQDPNRLAWVKHILEGKPPQEFALPVPLLENSND